MKSYEGSAHIQSGGANASRRQENVPVSCGSPGVVLDLIRTRSTGRTHGSAPACFSQYSREPSGFQGQPKPATSFRLRFVHTSQVLGGGSRGRSLLACRKRRKSENGFTSSGNSERKQTSSRCKMKTKTCTDSAMREPTTPSCTLYRLLFFSLIKSIFVVSLSDSKKTENNSSGVGFFFFAKF